MRLHLSTIAAGVCWGSMLFVLDTGQQDFTLLFKLLALTAILGTALNSMNAYFTVYANFVISTAIPIWLFLLGPADFLDTTAKLSLSMGTAIYATYLLLTGWRVHRLTRLYFSQQTERRITSYNVCYTKLLRPVSPENSRSWANARPIPRYENSSASSSLRCSFLPRNSTPIRMVRVG